jgi:DNA-binding response OmpR family regulator
VVVDDEHLIADTLVRILNMNGFEATAAYDGESALEIAGRLCPDIVLTDVRMPGRSGIDVGIELRSSCPATRVVLLSGQAGTSEILIEARRAGFEFELWPKPIHPRELVQRLRSA